LSFICLFASQRSYSLHVVLGDDLEPVDSRRTLKDLLIMLGPEPQAKAEIRRLLAVRDPLLKLVWEPATAGSRS